MLVLIRVTTFLAFSSLLCAQPTREVVDSLANLQACVNRPEGPELVCAMRASPTPYTISGASFIIRRPNTTVEGVADPGQDPPTLRRGDASIKKLIWIQRLATNVTIRNIQIDGNSSLVPGNGFQDLSVDASNATVADNHFGDSASLAMFFGAPHFTLRHNVFGKFIVKGALRSAPGVRPSRTAIMGWGPNANQFTIESNEVSDYNGALNINDAPAGTDPATAGVIANNTFYHNSICVPNCGGGQVYVSGKTTNVKITNNTIDGGWAESSRDRESMHNYGIEMDAGVSYIYSSSNKIFNNSISGIWIGNGAHHITIENDTVYNNGLNGVQISGSARSPVSSISIIGLTSNHNDRHRSSNAPYPTLPRFFGIMIQDGNASGVCIQNDSNLDSNGRGAIYAALRGGVSRSAACPRPYN